MSLPKTIAKLKADALLAQLRAAPAAPAEPAVGETNEPAPVDQDVTTEIPVDSPAPDQ